jgi:hypothetical protein
VVETEWREALRQHPHLREIMERLLIERPELAEHRQTLGLTPPPGEGFSGFTPEEVRYYKARCVAAGWN